MRCLASGGVVLIAVLTVRAAGAADIDADPANYESLVPTLRAGDTLHLAAGTYADLLNVSGLDGTAAAPIVITGPAVGAPAIFTADPGPCCNTIEIRNSSWVVLRDLTVDAQGVDGAFGVSAKDGLSNVVHDITVENCTFLNHGGSQQHVAISTKTPTWGWVIRGNRILGAGTGLYLGNSDGTSPFIAGVVEYNLVADPIGYCMQIKWQQPRPAVAGMPDGPSVTVVRHNVLIKTDRASPDGDRPNLLLGGFPASGPGAEDRYEVYGNFFFHNPRESLLQASGRVSIHDNVFVEVAGTAILLQDHDLPLRQAWVYNNTIYAAGTGISFGSTAPQGDAVVGNLVFAASPIAGAITDQRDNLTDMVATAGGYVAAPSITLGTMDFYPLAGQCQGTALDLGAFTGDVDYDRDFNGMAKGTFTFRGAYVGEGANPGWRLAQDVKPRVGGADGDGDGDGDGDADGDSGSDLGSDADTGSDSGLDAGGDAGAGSDASGGCECRSAGASRAGSWAFGLVVVVWLAGGQGGRRRRNLSRGRNRA